MYIYASNVNIYAYMYIYIYIYIYHTYTYPVATLFSNLRAILLKCSKHRRK